MGKLSYLQRGLASLPPRLAFADGLASNGKPLNRDQLQHWRAWYKTARWQKLRWSILVRDLFTCTFCKRVMADTSLLVADHIVAHRGDEARFWDAENLQCLCKGCHDGAKQAEEKQGRFRRR